jgi:uncharacterized membrane protein YphA (DoxX/SURF4 family)
MKKQTIVELISLFYVCLFLYTGVSKLMEIDLMQEQLLDIPLFSPIASIAAIGVPIVELVIAFLLFLPQTRILGLWGSLAMMSVFTFYIVYILNYNDDLPCTCGGIIQKLSWPQHLVFNLVSVGLIFGAITLNRKTFSLRNAHFGT